jgi:outer membrane protein OmpA-like peptidoglycan-associated protein
MKIFSYPYKTLLTVALASVILTACTTPTKPDGAASARSRLIQLQSDPELASRAPLAIKEADIAVTAAEKPQTDKILGAHLVYLADRRVAIAQAQAEARLAVDQRKTLGEEREAMRLQARTQEADAANRRATAAQADASDQKQRADAALSQADAANSAANSAAAEAQRSALELQRQIEELQAKVTDRGIVLTLGDVLFATGTATLNTGVSSNLGKLAGFLNAHPDRTVLIEGYTDSMGTDEYNQTLSERRAEAVKAYLMGQGINASRLTSIGKGESSPIGDNASSTGRQQNRRVEVIIANSLVSAR